MHWRVAPTRGNRVHRRNTGGRRLRAAAATGAVVVAAMPVLSADAVPSGGRSHEVFTQSNLIGLTSYPPGSEVRVEVVRRGSVIGSATKTTDGAGIIEMNHVGAEADDCFESPTSPDVRAGTGSAPDPARWDVDTSVVRGVRITRVRFGVPNARSIAVTGRVTLGNGRPPSTGERRCWSYDQQGRGLGRDRQARQPRGHQREHQPRRHLAPRDEWKSRDVRQAAGSARRSSSGRRRPRSSRPS